MDCLKSQNQCVNTAMFPGSVMESSYSIQSFSNQQESSANQSNCQLMYIPFVSTYKILAPYCFSAPKMVPVIIKRNIQKNTKTMIIHFHGNACDIGQITMCADRESVAFDTHYMLVEYPRYGISDGYPHESVINDVAYSVLQFVLNVLLINPDRIIITGRSIGTGPACWLASLMQLRGTPPLALVLQSPFTSIQDAASDLLGVISWFMLDRWPNWQYLIGTDPMVIRCPVLFIHADNDRIVNCNHSKMLHENRSKFKLPSELFIQRSTEAFIKNHNMFDYYRDLITPTQDFLSKITLTLPSNESIIISNETLAKYLQPPASYLRAYQLIVERERMEDELMNKSQNNEKEDNRSNDSRSPIHSSSSQTQTKSKWRCKCGMSKCDTCIRCSWLGCCCVFCCEGCTAIGLRCLNETVLFLSGSTPVFDYQKMRPKPPVKPSVPAIRTTSSFANLFFDRHKSNPSPATASDKSRSPSKEGFKPSLATSSSGSLKIESSSKVRNSLDLVKNQAKGLKPLINESHLHTTSNPIHLLKPSEHSSYLIVPLSSPHANHPPSVQLKDPVADQGLGKDKQDELSSNIKIDYIPG